MLYANEIRGLHHMIVFYNGKFLEKEDVNISPDDRGFTFGDGTYEVIRVYRGKPFRLSQHLTRLTTSLDKIGIRGVDVEPLDSASEELIIRNGAETLDASLYIQITRGAAPRHHRFPQNIEATVYMNLHPLPRAEDTFSQGVKIILIKDERWGRCDIKSIALLANVLAAEEAAGQDAYEAVFTRDGNITEGTHTNIAAVFHGAVHTHPLNHHILGGITRDFVLELCSGLGIRVYEAPIQSWELMQAEEVFLMGTSTEIMPVIQVNDLTIGMGEPGPVTRKLQSAFRHTINRTLDIASDETML